jgi:hypothetical protein
MRSPSARPCLGFFGKQHFIEARREKKRLVNTLNEAKAVSLGILGPGAFRRQTRLIVMAGSPRTRQMWGLDSLECSEAQSDQDARLVDTIIPPNKLFALAYSLVQLGCLSIAVRAKASLHTQCPRTGPLRCGLLWIWFGFQLEISHLALVFSRPRLFLQRMKRLACCLIDMGFTRLPVRYPLASDALQRFFSSHSSLMPSLTRFE